jgi:hypothetical protein
MTDESTVGHITPFDGGQRLVGMTAPLSSVGWAVSSAIRRLVDTESIRGQAIRGGVDRGRSDAIRRRPGRPYNKVRQVEFIEAIPKPAPGKDPRVS